MNMYLAIRRFLTDAGIRQAVSLTLFVCVLAPFHTLHATDYTADENGDHVAAPTIYGKPVEQPFEASARRHRNELMFDFARQQAIGLVPELSGWLGNSQGWALRGVRTLEDQLDLEDSDHTGAMQALEGAHPVSAMMQPPAASDAEAFWLSSGYHHMGVLPFHDAMLMGIDLRRPVVSDRLQLDLHPYYGENPLRANGIYGTDVSLSLHGRDAAAPWGQISIGYIGGNQDLLDHGAGIDLHSEVNFDEHFSLNTGVRQSENSDLGNYVMLQWKLVGD